VDLDTGAIVAVTVQGADEGDTTTIVETTIAAAEQVEDAQTEGTKCSGNLRLAMMSGGRSGRTRFAKKWWFRCPAVIECLNEAGDDLFTFLRFPKLQWKALRTTNALERINGELRRRTKTQASLPGQDAVLLLLFGLLRSGQVKLRTIDGWQQMDGVDKAA
jgi:Transposase, Mutator family